MVVDVELGVVDVDVDVHVGVSVANPTRSVCPATWVTPRLETRRCTRSGPASNIETPPKGAYTLIGMNAQVHTIAMEHQIPGAHSALIP